VDFWQRRHGRYDRRLGAAFSGFPSLPNVRRVLDLSADQAADSAGVRFRLEQARAGAAALCLRFVARCQAQVVVVAASRGLQKTLEFLRRTKNDAALDVLVPALHSASTAVQEGALAALLDRGSLAVQRDLLRRFPELGERWIAVVESKRGCLSQALRDAVLSTDARLCRHACDAIVRLREYDLAPAIVTALEGKPEWAGVLARTILQLANRLHEEGRQRNRPRPDLHIHRRGLVQCLEPAAQHYPLHRRSELVEAFLTVAGRDHPALKQMLSEVDHPCHAIVVDVLFESHSVGVMKLLLDFLEEPEPTIPALNILGRRCDLPFLDLLLARLSQGLSMLAALNLKRVETIPWADPQQGTLAALDDPRQQGAVELLMASGVKRITVFRTLTWLVKEGSAGGRRAAVSALAEFATAEAANLVVASLNDPDPHVQATALRQLRPRGIPGALGQLVAAADSPFAAIRAAAYEGLTEFRIKRYLLSFDTMADDVRRTTGALVRKIDPAALPMLREELTCDIEARRLRAVRAAQAMNATRDVEAALIERLLDENHLIRVEAAAALSQNDSPGAQAALRDALRDKSQLVREAARESLDTIARRAASHAPFVVPPAPPLAYPPGHSLPLSS
jgi:HEAT repeat protein